MKKFLAILGSIFLALIVLGGVAIAILAFRGNALDQESRDYTDGAIKAIFSANDDKELIKRASPELMQVITTAQLDEMFRTIDTLGPLQRTDPPQGQSMVGFDVKKGKTVTAQYLVKAHFEKSDGVITLGIIKHGDQWQIINFHVNAPQFFAPLAPAAVKA